MQNCLVIVQIKSGVRDNDDGVKLASVLLSSRTFRTCITAIPTDSPATSGTAHFDVCMRKLVAAGSGAILLIPDAYLVDLISFARRNPSTDADCAQIVILTAADPVAIAMATSVVDTLRTAGLNRIRVICVELVSNSDNPFEPGAADIALRGTEIVRLDRSAVSKVTKSKISVAACVAGQVDYLQAWVNEKKPGTSPRTLRVAKQRLHAQWLVSGLSREFDGVLAELALT